MNQALLFQYGIVSSRLDDDLTGETLRSSARALAQGVPDAQSSTPGPSMPGSILTYSTPGRGPNGESSN